MYVTVYGKEICINDNLAAEYDRTIGMPLDEDELLYHVNLAYHAGYNENKMQSIIETDSAEDISEKIQKSMRKEIKALSGKCNN